ncbi:MAG: division/cell wall cluster transcriptional repressor MraZ [Bacillota bacterium]|nr:division/cell wall cluster transcriptional repressor MraZ [Bacillota bacterium]
MLLGQYQHNIDTKGRLIIPGKFREDLGESFIVTRGVDNSLFVYPMKEWLLLDEKIRALPLSTGRDLQRFFFSNAEEVSPDAQGRILIPVTLRKYAHLNREVVVIGASSRVEIWDKTTWDKNADNLTSEAILDAMTELGF